MDTTRVRGTMALWLVVVGTVLTGLTALLLDVPSAAFLLAALCAVLAVLRGTDRRAPVTFRARSTVFDVTALAVVAVALAVLAPAGNLT